MSTFSNLWSKICDVAEVAPLAGIFLSVFLAELGDKTQLATLLYTTEGSHSPWAVFAAAASALVLSTGIAVIVGRYASEYLTALPLPLIAGIGFILMGAYSIYGYLKA